jgi:hypothetical protein
VGGKDQLLHKVTLGYGSSFSIKLDESFLAPTWFVLDWQEMSLCDTLVRVSRAMSVVVGQGNVALDFQETPVL